MTQNKINRITKILLESTEIDRAELILAAKGLSDDIEKMSIDLAKTQIEDIAPIVDRIKVVFGMDVALSFESAVNSAVSGAVESLKMAKTVVGDEVLRLTGELPPQQMDVANNSTDGFGGEDSAAGPEDEPVGRERKEVTEAKNTREKARQAVINKLANKLAGIEDKDFDEVVSIIKKYKNINESTNQEASEETLYKHFREMERILDARIKAGGTVLASEVAKFRDLHNKIKKMKSHGVNEAASAEKDQLIDEILSVVMDLDDDGYQAATELMGINDADRTASEDEIATVLSNTGLASLREIHSSLGGVSEALKKGDKVTVNGKHTEVTVPDGPGNLVGIEHNGTTKMVDAKKVELVVETVSNKRGKKVFENIKEAKAWVVKNSSKIRSVKVNK